MTARSLSGSRPTSVAGTVVAILERDGQLVGVLDDVIVGHDAPVGVDEEAGADALRLHRLPWPVGTTAMLVMLTTEPPFCWYTPMAGFSRRWASLSGGDACNRSRSASRPGPYMTPRAARSPG